MIRQNIDQILSELPNGVELVAAAKTRKPEEVLEDWKAICMDLHFTLMGNTF